MEDLQHNNIFEQAQSMTNNFLKVADTYGLGSLVKQQQPENPADYFSYLMQSGANANPYSGIEPQHINIHNPNYENQFVDRYKALNAYDQYGFSPMRDNEALYNEVASGWDNFQRAFGQMVSLGATAFVDSATWGAFSEDTAEKFKIANSIGMSSKKGAGAFALNLMVSSGYTLGILADIAAEEILAAALTSTIIGAPAGAAEAASGLSKLGRLATGIKDALGTQGRLYRQLNNISNSSSFGEVIKNIGVGAAHIVNPFESTMSAVQNIHKLEEAGETVAKSKKIKDGVLGLWMDTINAKNALTESMLEGNFAEDELHWDMVSDFKQAYGRMPNAEEAEQIAMSARAANYATTMANLPLIYTTNKMTFGLMARPIESLGKNFFKLGGTELIRETNKQTGKTIVREMSSEFLKHQLEVLRNPKLLAKNLLVYSQDNFFEGFQEISQDVISGTAKDYYNAKYNNALRGGWYNYLSQNMSDQMSRKGLETFMSGFLMQKMIAPVAGTMGRVLKGGVTSERTFGDRMQSKMENAFQRITSSKEEYEKFKQAKQERFDQAEKDLQETITILQDAFNANPALFFNGHMDNLLSSERISQLIDQKRINSSADVKKYLEQCYITALQTGQFDGVIETLNSMKKMSSEDLKSVWGIDKTNDFYKNIDNAINEATATKSRYEAATKISEKPFTSIDIRNSSGETRKIMQQANISYDEAVRHYTMLSGIYEENLKNQMDILSELQNAFNKDSELRNIPYELVTPLTGRTTLMDRITDINSVLEGTEGTTGLLSLDEKTLDEKTKKEIENLKAERDSLVRLNHAVNKYIGDDTKYNELVDEIKSYIKDLAKGVKDSYISTTKLDDVAKIIANNYTLIKEGDDYSKDIAYLTDPMIFKRYVNLIHAQHKIIFDSLNKTINDSMDKFKERASEDKFISDLDSIDVFITEDELKNLDENNKMPHVFDSLTKRPLSYFSDKYQQAYRIIKARYPNVHDIPVEGVQEEQSSGVFKRDRLLTYDEIIKNYGGLEGKGKQLNLNKEYNAEDVANFILGQNNLLSSEKELINSLLPYLKDKKIKFTNTSSKAVSFDEDVITIDIRYFSSDYQKRTSRLEFGILKGLVGSIINEQLTKDENFRDEIQNLRKKARDAFDKLSEEDKLENAEAKFGLEDDLKFCVEAMCNFNFQSFLSTVKGDGKTPNAFRDFVNKVIQQLKNLLHIDAKNTLLDDSLYVITDALLQEKKPTSTSSEKKTSKKVLTVNDSTKDILDYPEEIKKELVNAFLEIKRFEADERFLHMDMDDIIKESAFMKWFKDSAHANNIRDKENKKNLSDAEYFRMQYDVSKPLYVDNFTAEQKKSYNNGIVTPVMLFMVASKLMKTVGNTLSGEMLSLYNSKYKDDIDKIINIHSTKENFPINGEVMTDEKLIRYLADEMGYNIGQLKSLPRTELNVLAIDNINVADRIRLSQDTSQDFIEQTSTMRNIELEFENCNTEKELENKYELYNEWIDNLIADDKTLYVTKEEIFNLYISNNQRILNQRNEQIMTAEELLNPGCQFFYKGNTCTVLKAQKKSRGYSITILNNNTKEQKTFGLKELVSKISYSSIIKDQKDIEDVEPTEIENIKHSEGIKNETKLNMKESKSSEDLNKDLEDNCK